MGREAVRSPLASLAASLRQVVNNTPVSYAPRGSSLGIFGAQRSDAEQQMRAYGSVGTLFAIVHRLSNATSQVDWHLYRKARSGNPDDRVEVTSHLALDIWNKPNKFYTRQEFVESVQQHVDLTGEGWWLVGRDPRATLPLELWPVRPDRMSVVPSPTDFLTGYIYRGPDGEQVPLGLTDVVQMRMPNPLDPYRGMGPVQSLLVHLDAAKYTAEWNRNFFLNSAEPGGIIEVDKRLSDDEFDEMTSRWREQHQGVAQAHRVAVLEQGKWVDRKFSQRDMQFTELLGVTKETIREAYGFPLPMLGTSQDVNRAAAEAGEYVFARWLIVSRLERWKGALNNDFLPLFGSAAAGLEFDYESPVPEDQAAENAELTTKVNAAKQLVELGYDRADVLDKLGLPDIAIGTTGQGDASTIAEMVQKIYLGVGIVLSAEEARDILNRGGAGLSAQVPDFAPPAPPAQPLTARAHHHALPFPARNAADLNPADLPDISHMASALDDALSKLLTQWADLTAAQKDALVAMVQSIAEHGSLDELAHLQVDSSAAAEALFASMVELAAVAGRQMADEAAAQDVDIPSSSGDRAGMHSVSVVVAALLATELAVSASRAAMRANGPVATPRDIADAVRVQLDSLSTANAETQLGAALHGSMNSARLATLQAAPEGAVYASEVMDKNTCKPCREINGRWLGNISDMAMIEKSYPAGAYGGYVDCEGGPRCRGTVVGAWRPAQAG
jgi:HK97 family phage portal protein